MKKNLYSALLLSLCLVMTGCNTFLDIVKSDQIETDANKRTRGAKLDDRSIETIVKHNIAKSHSDLDKAHIEVNSFNGVVLVTGEVPTEPLKELTRTTAQAVANVRVVHNEVTVRGNSTVFTRINDSYLHTRVKFKLSKEEILDGADMDVVIQNSNAFLMGLVTQEQGEVAAHVTSLTGGINSVIKVFEYLD